MLHDRFEMEKAQGFGSGALERLQSLRTKSFRFGAMEKQKSLRQQISKDKDSPVKKGDTVLHLTARDGNLISVKKIIFDFEDDVQLKDLICTQNQDGESVLYVACEKGFLGIVKEVLKVSDVQSASIKARNGYDAFHIAAKHGHFEIVKELYESFPALAMTTNSSNSTALDTAATQGHIDIVNLLLGTGVDLAKIARNNGKTALHSAARMGHVDIVKSILNKDPSISFRTDKKGQTAFHMAVKGNNVDIVRELLEPDKSTVNLEDSKGNTALHIAVRKGRLMIVKFLLSLQNINLNAVNRANETPLAIAITQPIQEISTTLQEAGATTSIPQNQPSPKAQAKQLNQTITDIKHDVRAHTKQSNQTNLRVQTIKKRLKKLHIGGLNNAINSNTVVAVLIATVAFAAIFTLPGQYVDTPTSGFTLGEAYIANDTVFIVFLVFDSLALFISLAVVVVQTSVIVVEQKEKMLMVFVMNKLMWLACVFISVSFISLTYIVVGKHDLWLAWCTMAIGTSVMMSTIGLMCYCIVVHRIEEKNMKSMEKARRSECFSLAVGTDHEVPIDGQFKKKMYAL